MPANNPKTGSGGFTAEERAAMRRRAAELRAEGKKADARQAVLDSMRRWRRPTVRPLSTCI